MSTSSRVIWGRPASASKPLERAIRLRAAALALAGACVLAACQSTGESETSRRRSSDRDAVLAVLTNPQAPPPPTASAGGAPVENPVINRSRAEQPQPARDRTPSQPVAAAAPPANRAPAAEVTSAPIGPSLDQAAPAVEPRQAAPAPRSSASRRTALPAAAPAVDGTDLASRIGDLPGQTLEPGTCGMFLFRRQARAKLVFFSRGLEGTARMSIDGDVVELERNEVSGTAFAGLHARQAFSHEGYEVEIDLQIQQSARILEGAEIPQGRLRIQDPQGWSFVMPVAGLIACQSSRVPATTAR